MRRHFLSRFLIKLRLTRDNGGWATPPRRTFHCPQRRRVVCSIFNSLHRGNVDNARGGQECGVERVQKKSRSSVEVNDSLPPSIVVNYLSISPVRDPSTHHPSVSPTCTSLNISPRESASFLAHVS
jgi:hypothetical protein